MSELQFSTSGIVHLLQAVKLQPRNARVVRVEARGASKGTGIFRLIWMRNSRVVE